MRSYSSNIVASGSGKMNRFFAIDQGHNLSLSTNISAQEMAELLVPPWVAVTNATYTGTNVARGAFTSGNGCGLPIDSGFLLSSGPITDAVGPNDSSGFSGYLGSPGDTDLDALVGGNKTLDAAVLEFDIIATNTFEWHCQYIYASEEYPEFISVFNDPMAIFVSTNQTSSGWVNTTDNNISLIPGTTNTPVSVSTVNGGCPALYWGGYASSTNAQYYVDNHDPEFSSLTQHAAPSPVYYIEYDGTTTLLTARLMLQGNATNHVKIAIADYAGGIDDREFDSAVLINTWTPLQSQ